MPIIKCPICEEKVDVSDVSNYEQHMSRHGVPPRPAAPTKEGSEKAKVPVYVLKREHLTGIGKELLKARWLELFIFVLVGGLVAIFGFPLLGAALLLLGFRSIIPSADELMQKAEEHYVKHIVIEVRKPKKEEEEEEEEVKKPPFFE
ncbi:MAG: hypothetical protein QW227_02830 [Candidatus Aenigmatarchaeota archaeon]